MIYSPLCDFPALVGIALESSASVLSNAVSMSIWELHSGEWEACKSELEATRLMVRPLSHGITLHPSMHE